jgi:hypothetical protein
VIYLLWLVWTFDAAGSYAEVHANNIEYSSFECRQAARWLNETKGSSLKWYECRVKGY